MRAVGNASVKPLDVSQSATTEVVVFRVKLEKASNDYIELSISPRELVMSALSVHRNWLIAGQKSAKWVEQLLGVCNPEGEETPLLPEGPLDPP
jgi:hypothetical protein